MAVTTESTEDATPSSWDPTRTWLLRLLSVQLALVVVTGVALYFWYQPSASQA